MLTIFDVFVTWFARQQPFVLFLVGFVGAQVFTRIWDALKSPGTYDCRENEDADNN